MYDAQLGRWHTVDPLGEITISITPYVYCFDNPINFIDSDGRQGEVSQEPITPTFELDGVTIYGQRSYRPQNQMYYTMDYVYINGNVHYEWYYEGTEPPPPVPPLHVLANITPTLEVPEMKPEINFNTQLLPPQDKKPSGWRSVLDGVQWGFDALGLVPGLGEVFDGLNAAIYLARGDYVSAALSAAAMIPIGGQAATLAKIGLKAGRKAKKAAKTVSGVYDIVIDGERYIGQSKNIAKRLKQHANKANKELIVNKFYEMPNSTPLEREIVEQYMIRDAGGIDNLRNVKNPIGTKRIEKYEKNIDHLLKENGIE